MVSSKYFRPVAPSAVETIARLAADSQPDFLFLNQVALVRLAPLLRRYLLSACKIVLLSHGLESTDLLHFIRLRKRLPLSGRVRPSASISLGQAILFESAMRQHVDVVCSLSPFDVELEHWIGAARVGWIPRTIRPKAFDWKPTGQRIGFVGTLDHAPNLEGLVIVLDRLARRNDAAQLRIRIVGGPISTGNWIAQKYPLVDYLGQLDDRCLSQEAETWNAFMHPIFCYSRGCSTKLATAISWGIPVITTTAGYRGYEWREGHLVVADDPDKYSQRCIDLCDYPAAAAARDEVIKVMRSTISSEEVTRRMRNLLALELPQSL